jgi:hypothetical protein
LSAFKKQRGSQEWEEKYMMYPSLVSYRIREEVRNKEGNLSLSCQFKSREEARSGRRNIFLSCH